MITLQRLVELRADDHLLSLLRRTCEHATSLVAVDIKAMSKKIAVGKAVGQELEDANDGAVAMMLALYEEGRRPLVEFLLELDKSAVVRARPHLHAKLKELIK